jgi:16S rRNA (cytidine1402-2'-O)-methyltransferase
LILYAIPTPLGGSAKGALPSPSLEIISSLKDFVVENAKSARAFLADAGLAVRDLNIVEIEKSQDPLAPLRQGRSMGLLSEAGCPAIADPGAALVEAAHREGFRVVPLVGPSSIVLALMASGLEGQRFAFCGYLPREKADRERRIRELEKRSRTEDETQIFIETPYRNDALLDSLLEVGKESTRLCIATDLTLPSESIRTKSIDEWKKNHRPIGKRPTVFLMHAQLADGR